MKDLPVTPESLEALKRVKALTPEVLTPAEAREMRRKTRKLSRTEQERGLRILRHAMKNLDRGKPEKAVQTILRGFGGIILAKLREKVPL